MSMIYEPKGQAREYFPLACNIYAGCDHGCTYCYAPAVTRKSRERFHAVRPRPDFLKKLQAQVTKEPGEDRIVLLSFTCDPYCNLDSELAITHEAIKILKEGGYRVQILTKGGSRARRDFYMLDARDGFAVTLTTLDEAESAQWEPHAALPKDRISSLSDAKFLTGAFTWVSLEPVINPEMALSIIRHTHEFTDVYKIGKLNYDSEYADQIDWVAFAESAIEQCEQLGARYYIKESLHEYLPDFEPQDPDDFLP